MNFKVQRQISHWQLECCSSLKPTFSLNVLWTPMGLAVNNTRPNLIWLKHKSGWIGCALKEIDPQLRHEMGQILSPAIQHASTLSSQCGPNLDWAWACVGSAAWMGRGKRIKGDENRGDNKPQRSCWHA
jgi:hypothetical protein